MSKKTIFKNINFESYLISDIQKNYHFFLNEFEFNLLRIHRFLYKSVKEKVECNHKYSIKGNTFPNAIFFKTKYIEFQTTIWEKIIRFNGSLYTIMPKGRCITFFHDGKEEIRFIPDATYLQQVLKELKIKSFYVSNDKNSNVSIDDPFQVFEDENITNLYDCSENKILSEENFDKRFKNSPQIIKDISINSYIYFEKSCDEAFISNIYSQSFADITHFTDSTKKILYLFNY